jgi:hypothetical protein
VPETSTYITHCFPRLWPGDACIYRGGLCRPSPAYCIMAVTAYCCNPCAFQIFWSYQYLATSDTKGFVKISHLSPNGYFRLTYTEVGIWGVQSGDSGGNSCLIYGTTKDDWQ